MLQYFVIFRILNYLFSIRDSAQILCRKLTIETFALLLCMFENADERIIIFDMIKFK